MKFAVLITFLSAITQAAPAPDGEVLFATKILPLFNDKCLACHGKDPQKIKAGYDMRTRDTAIKGGESEKPSIISGNADASPLYLAVTRAHEEDWKPMPPKQNDKLSSEQVADIKTWINAGAPWPDEAKTKALADKWSAPDGITVKTSGGLGDDWTNRRYKPENLWAYQPVKASSKSIDELIASHLPKDVKPAPRADARTLIRRITYDLTGLPPTPEEINAFEAEASHNSQTAIRDLIDRLLESPHYGEQWGRHWLDVVRYADSSGFANDYERGNAWRYRDYVIRSFNNDKPYSQFITEQIAGDEIDDHNPELLVACGFLRMGPWELTSMEVPKIARQRFLDDVTNSVGEVFLAHSLQCARCHDHKFDPIPTRDYYSMQACFATTQLVERPASFLPAENITGFEEKTYIEQRKADFTNTLKAIDAKLIKAADGWFDQKDIGKTAWKKALAQSADAPPIPGKGKTKVKGAKRDSIYDGARAILASQGVPEDEYPPKQLGFTTEDYGMDRIARKGLERLNWELDRYQPIAFSLYIGRTPDVKSVTAPRRMPPDPLNKGELEQEAILAGGDPFSPTQKVEPSTLSVLSAFTPLAMPIPNGIAGRRLALSHWIASKDNPLTARVMMNRVWLWHFGQPIAGNPNNFGSTGKKPTHPELLDSLAAQFMDNGWSLKAIHRIIMSSEAYLRSAEQAAPGTASSREELESLHAIFKPRRLTSEELRDSMLAASGELNPRIGGIPARPEINLEAAMQPRQVMGTFAAAWEPSPKPEQRHRRSIYALKIRGLRDPFMEVFNEPAPDFSCERRDVSTVTPQVFSLFNGKASYDRALALAHRAIQQSSGNALKQAFTLAMGRQPEADELAALQSHWQTMTKRHESLTFAKTKAPASVVREAVEENTGEKFRFNETLNASHDFIPDLQPSDVDARTRALADVCLVLFNSNEFCYVY
ncbi:MAG: Planctomycete cytochrome [Verrucomicrobiaceae bacterium]|nr:Planctomycete cytochrome [Verrucomicrobiaceae bacterium]